MWISNFPTPFTKKIYASPIKCSWCPYQKLVDCNSVYQKDICPPTFTVALTITKLEKHISCLLMNERIRKQVIHICMCKCKCICKVDIIYYNRVLFSHIKEGNLVISDNKDKTGEDYAKWNKPKWERQTVYSITYMEFKKKSPFHRMVVAKRWEEGETVRWRPKLWKEKIVTI